MSVPRILFIFGTRPEAIKLCPLVLHMRERAGEFDPRVCVTAQHRGLLDGMLSRFGVTADHDLNVMRPNQSLSGLTARILQGLDPLLQAEKPAMIVVQGDTTTTFAGALAAFYHQIPVGHVEAGLRTGDLTQPFPEELNRVLSTRLSALHFAPTRRAASNLAAEGVPPESILVTGNTGIDAISLALRKLESGEWPGYAGKLPPSGKHLILLTAHRRESFGEGFERICEAALRIVERGDTEIIYPVHPNPNVQSVVERRMRRSAAIHLVEPQDYVPFVDLMRRADILLTDSGGVQEEGPSLRKPVLVLRDKTERQEAVEAGTARLVGTDVDRITAEVNALLDQPLAREAFTRAENPFGDGHACPRIADAIRSFLDK